MPADFPTWFFYVLLGTVALIPAGKWIVRAIGQQIVVEIRVSLEPFIRSVAREELDVAIDGKLQPIHDQLQPNKGSSMHDRLTVIEELLHTWEINQAADAERHDPPDGTPV